MERKLLTVIEGVRLEIDGHDILLIRIPMPPDFCPPNSPKEVAMKSFECLQRLSKKLPIVFVSPKGDGTLFPVFPQEWQEKLRSKTILVSQLTKIPIFEDDLESPDSSRRF